MHGGDILTLPVILGISGTALNEAERDMLARYQPRGIILFGRNIENPDQLAALTASLRQRLAPGAVLMVDQEGGRVARLRAPFWPALPAAGTLKTADEAFTHGQKLGEMSRAAGFDVVAAPVLDLRHPGADDIVGDRAISDDPKIVAELGGRIAAGILHAGATPVMKHMPGHGRAMVDSHKALPRVATADLDDDYYPFAKNALLPWGMTAHIVFESIDPRRPATLSPVVIRDVIRGKMGFAGTLVSDDLAMGALTGTPTERVLAALAAGCDVALYCTGILAETLAILQALDG
jgi:beta-N-acetylhexosaminidase